MSSDPAIEIRDLRMVYRTRGGSVEALRTATFDVAAGSFHALVGPSGCGKSTILKIVAGLITEHEGVANVAGSPARAGRPDTGIMLQSPVLLPWRTVLKNVLLAAEMYGLPRAEAEDRARRLLKLVGLDGFEDKHAWELSGGMQQRVSLARLLVFDPSILLLDEPFAALDEFTRERLNLELAGIHERSSRSVLYVTHNIQEAVLLSDRVVVMKPRPGEIVEIVDIDLPRPRSRATIDSPRAIELVTYIRGLLYAASEEDDEEEVQP